VFAKLSPHDPQPSEEFQTSQDYRDVSRRLTPQGCANYLGPAQAVEQGLMFATTFNQ
jgi:hypothetical protein